MEYSTTGTEIVALHQGYRPTLVQISYILAGLVDLGKTLFNKSSGRGSSSSTYLNVGTGIDLVHSVSRGPASLAVQVVALDEHSVVTQATHPQVALSFALQLDTFSNV